MLPTRALMLTSFAGLSLLGRMGRSLQQPGSANHVHSNIRAHDNAKRKHAMGTKVWRTMAAQPDWYDCSGAAGAAEQLNAKVWQSLHDA